MGIKKNMDKLSKVERQALLQVATEAMNSALFTNVNHLVDNRDLSSSPETLCNDNNFDNIRKNRKKSFTFRLLNKINALEMKKLPYRTIWGAALNYYHYYYYW